MRLDLVSKNILKISVMGLLIATIIILWNVFTIETTFLKISFAFIPKMLMGAIFGPLPAAIGEVLADIIGNTLFSRGTFFVGFTFNKFLEGLVYGYFFNKKNISLKNTIICMLSITIVINLFLTPIWLVIMYNIPLNNWVIWIPRLIKNVIFVPFQIVIIFLLLKRREIKKILKLMR